MQALSTSAADLPSDGCNTRAASPVPPPLQYYFYPLEEAMGDAGFKHVECHELDPRHRIVLGAKL